MATLKVGDIPPEMACRPLAYIAIIGLDVPKNPIHTAIWEAFTTNRQPDRASLSFKLLTEGYDFPKTKPKHASYEWYVPKGILKTNWLSKHMGKVPAVAVLFYDLDWDDPLWAEKRMDCANKLEALRSSLQGRNTRVSLVLMQQKAPLPFADDGVASERAAALCSACDLSAKTLFVLPHSDHLFGYILRLENAFNELAQTYYHQESRHVKNHREHLNKTMHQLLFVRHQFKIAFLSELKQDNAIALKHYKQAYANLMEVRASDTNILEVKTIAGFINYKICQLSFLNNTPLDSISQFRKHVDIFKSKIGSPELAFEHSAWMSKQFSHFGDLFDEAVKQGLGAVQTQHPGFYYQQAANHAITRKNLCQKLCKYVTEYPSTDPLVGADTMEYYGQRPWRQGSQSLEPPDPQKETEGIQTLQFKEASEIDHSMIIIPLLSSAIAQFKKYKCPRMKRQLMVQMGEEYYSCKDYTKALTLLKHVLWDYRTERWKPLVSSILITSLRCAYLSGSIQDFIILGVEVIGSWIQCGAEEKTTIQTSINNLFQEKLPFPLPGIAEEDVKSAEGQWLLAMSNKNPLILTVQMGSIIPFIECKAGFTSKSFTADQRVTVEVHLRMNCPQPMTFSKLNVLFSNSHYNNFCEIPSADEPDSNGNDKGCHLYLVPRKTHMFNFSFLPAPSDINQDIQLTYVALQLGVENKLCAVLHWEIAAMDNLQSPLPNQGITKGMIVSDDPSFQQIIVDPSTSILPRHPRLTIDVNHEPPALLNECYVLSICVTSEEVSNISEVIMSIGIKKDQEQSLHKTTFFSEDPEFKGQYSSILHSLSCGVLAPGDKVEKKIYMKTTFIATRKIFIQVSYNIDLEFNEQPLHCTCSKTKELEIQTVEPLKFALKILNMKFETQSLVRADEPFLLKIDIISQSTLPIHLLDGSLNLSSHVKTVDEDVICAIKDVTLNQRECASECCCLVTPTTTISCALGSYNIHWKRSSSQSDYCSVQTVVTLPVVEVHSVPLYVELDTPPHGWVRTPMTVTYYLHNRLFSVQDVELLVDSSDAFMYAGNKQLHFRILPQQKYKLSYNLYPLLAGYVPLPKLRLVLNPGSANALAVDDLVQQMVPSRIFIMPQGKNSVEEVGKSA